MIQKTVDLVTREFRPLAAFNNVAKIASFHRIQASPGFRHAAEYICSTLTSEGLEAEVISYPASKGVNWWAQESFPEWEAKDAELLLLEDGQNERLCSYAESKISLIQRSAPTPPEGVKTTMVLVEKGDDPKSYEGVDVAGKIVFSRGNVSEIAALAVDNFGAVGIAVDNMQEHPPIRDRFDLPCGRQYLSFWPSDVAKHKAFGFVLTPRQGAALRARFAEGKKEIKVFARVDSRFYDGTLEVVSAVIPGQTQMTQGAYEEVVGIAHLCHPEPSANDNASGSGALMEAAATLGRLIHDGCLPTPKRTMRFLWVPEITGSYAYLSNHEEAVARTVAAINLDMVGENQNLCGSTFIVEKSIKALPGFGGDLAEAVLHLMLQETGNIAGNHSYPMFRWTVAPYSGGSDHNLWGDPSVGVTCPMLIQWPDKFYHTSQDTIDKVDPQMLKLAGTLTATYLYTAACGDPSDASFVAGEMATRFAGELDASLSSIMKKTLEDLAKATEQGSGQPGSSQSGSSQPESSQPESSQPRSSQPRNSQSGNSQGSSQRESPGSILARARRSIERRVTFLTQRKHLDIDSLVRLSEDTEMLKEARLAGHSMVDGTSQFLLTKFLRDLATLGGLSSIVELPQAWEPKDDAEKIEKAKSIVPKRLFRGPFRTVGKEVSPELKAKMKEFNAKYGNIRAPLGQMEYWADGVRTLFEIAEIIQGDTGFWDLGMLLDYFELMCHNGMFSHCSPGH